MPAHLVALEYETDEAAGESLATLVALEGEGALAIEDAAVVSKRADGRVELRQARSPAAGETLVGGGTLGLLIGLALGVPVIGAILGMAGGGGAAAVDHGISDDRMRRFGDELEPGHAAVFALLRKVDWELLRSRVEPYRGRLVASEVDDDVLSALGTGTGP
jgi:uncharacterized membrane protein